ncbi:MAG: hypothetical protein ABI843_08020 [Dokdonella sp.]
MRRPIWLALSDRNLDTSDRMSVRVASRELARSTYTRDELHANLFDEVHPVVARNLCAIASVWDPFDPSWLAACTLRNRQRLRWSRPRGCGQRRDAVLMWRLLAPRIAGLRTAGMPPCSRFDFHLGK